MERRKTAIFVIQAGSVSLKSQSDRIESLRLARQFKKGCLPENWKSLVHEVFQVGELYEKSNRLDHSHSSKTEWHQVSDRERAVFVADCVLSEGFRPEVIELSTLRN